MTSISGSAAPMPVFRMHKNDWLPKPLTPREQLAKQRALKRKTQLEAEQLALEYSVILLQRSIQEALDPATDPRLRRDLRNDVLNRGIGKVRDEDTEEAAQRKKGNGADVLVDFLHAISQAHSYPTITHQPGAAVPEERDVTPGHTEHGGEWFEQYPTSTEVNDDE